ncbi:MAG: ABC transporter ATP-binding protein [Planctomycetes bacterium]|nr:ABC transporter ATP-binding protein [Planctomycetota bacterium]
MNTTTVNNLLEIGGVHVSFRDRSRRFAQRRVQAVRGVDLSIKRGGCVGLIGESGCGKSTLARAMLGLVPIDAGEIVFDGCTLSKLRGAELQDSRRRMQMVFQQASDSMNPRMTVESIICDPLRCTRDVTRRQWRERVTEALHTVGLGDELRLRFPHELSGGQLQRVALARALVLKPEFLICDEPVSALDVTAQNEILQQISSIRRERSLTLLLITHDLDIAANVCDTIAVMYLGRIVESGSVDEVMNNPLHPYTFYLNAARAHLRQAEGRHAPSLTGPPPSPVDPPAGCAFHPRCPLATDVCQVESPELAAVQGVDNDHVAACHHSDRIGELVELATPSARAMYGKTRD